MHTRGSSVHSFFQDWAYNLMVKSREHSVIYYRLACPDTGSRGLHTAHPVSGRACGPQENIRINPQMHYFKGFLVVFSIVIYVSNK